EQQRRDQGGDIRVDDRRHSFTIAVIDGRDGPPPCPHFLANALEYQDIRIHCHADRQDNARDARQGQRGLEDRQGRQERDDINDQRSGGHGPEKTVNRHHEDYDKYSSKDRGKLTGCDRISAQAGTDGSLFQNHQLCRQGAGAKQERQILSFLGREAARNHASPAQDRLSYDRGRDNLVIKHDRKEPPYVITCRIAETLGADGVEPEGDDRLAILESGLSVYEIVAAYHYPVANDKLVGLPCRPNLARGQEPRTWRYRIHTRHHILIHQMEGHAGGLP